MKVVLLVDIINLLIINLNDCLVAAHVFQLRSFQVKLGAMQFYSNKLNIFFLHNNNMPDSRNNLSAWNVVLFSLLTLPLATYCLSLHPSARTQAPHLFSGWEE